VRGPGGDRGGPTPWRPLDCALPDERMPVAERTMSADDCATAADPDHAFEAQCIRARHACNLRNLQALRPDTLLEIGCGDDFLYDHARDAGLPFSGWTIVEPAEAYASLADERAAIDPRLCVLRGYFEDVAKPGGPLADARFDAVLLSGLLPHVPDATRVVRDAVAHLRPGGSLLVTCANARSFHRLLAVEMGLIASPDELGARNLAYGQFHVFDRDSLGALLAQAGLVDLRFEGYLFKPFAHAQMRQVLELLPDGAGQALDALGRKFPDNAAEISFVGRRG
jgi:SAM-dependent methyltransferase